MAQQQIDIKKTSDKWLIVPITICLLMLASVPCVILGLGWLTAPHYDPVEEPLNLTKALLDAAAEPINNLPPTTLPGDVRGVHSQCWNFLKTALAKNNNQYRMEGRLLPPDHTPTGAYWVIVSVTFADNTQAEMDFYNTFMISCGETKASSKQWFLTPAIGKP